MLKIKKMREQVKGELDGIPRGDIDQNMLRQAYWALRTHNLGIRAKSLMSKEETLIQATKLIQKDTPKFNPDFQESVFDIDKLCSAARKESGVNSDHFCSIRRKR